MPSTGDLVTVVSPAYEAGESVREALASVLAQTHANLEVLVYDDGSQHVPVPQDLSDDPRVSVVRQGRNTGYAGVSNAAVQRASGEWITWVDSDDVVDPLYVQRLLELGVRNGASVVFSPQMQVRDGIPIGWTGWDPPGEVVQGRQAVRALMTGAVPGNQHLLLRDARPVADLSQTYADWAFVLAHVARAECVAFLSEAHYEYRLHAGSVTGTLRESIWDVPRLDEVAAPVADELFDPREAAELKEARRRYTVTTMLHAASQAGRTPLRGRVAAWCRARMSWGDVRAMWRDGRRSAAGSWALALFSMPAHRAAFRAYEWSKTRGKPRRRSW